MIAHMNSTITASVEFVLSYILALPLKLGPPIMELKTPM